MAIKDLRQTHTVAELAITEGAFDEILDLLEIAGYQHCFTYDPEGRVTMIDMTGIGITKSE